MTTDNRVEAVAEETADFLRRNFPQIAMHGGRVAIQDVDVGSGEVWIRLSGTCGECGISAMTTRAIQNSLPVEIEPIDTVHVETVERGT